jgi:hypothetical protein
VRQAPIVIVALALVAGAGSQACSRGERTKGGPEATTDQTKPSEGVTSASAERQVITLTGCLKRDVQPGSYVLASVATGGVLDDKSAAQQERRKDVKRGDDRMRPDQPGANPDTATPNSQATLAAGSSYQLIAAADDQRQELAKHENQRVAVRGRLAADQPVGTSGKTGANAPDAGGKVVDSSATNATVAGSAAPLRGFQVESVRKVGDSCQ